jgi:hypothetical protein
MSTKPFGAWEYKGMIVDASEKHAETIRESLNSKANRIVSGIVTTC